MYRVLNPKHCPSCAHGSETLITCRNPSFKDNVTSIYTIHQRKFPPFGVTRRCGWHDQNVTPRVGSQQKDTGDYVVSVLH
ncbi:hypothetical protein JTE90_029464 [Oedothorax gibbosus]|uniref:Uncharacterized protein n=1 Tax=Oedothorax gibbosus TaxID=931172 RepID=A0AAV6V5T5_9ARAC|nr:hypothetical protein JTE90_029464 [Oedothorax gibbosus]